MHDDDDDTRFDFYFNGTIFKWNRFNLILPNNSTRLQSSISGTRIIFFGLR